MVEYPILLPEELTPDQVLATVDACCAEEGLVPGLRGEQKSYPGSVHWHYKRVRERGTLEITFWPRGRRLWISVQAGRAAGWIDETLPRLRPALEAALRAAAGGS